MPAAGIVNDDGADGFTGNFYQLDATVSAPHCRAASFSGRRQYGFSTPMK